MNLAETVGCRLSSRKAGLKAEVARADRKSRRRGRHYRFKAQGAVVSSQHEGKYRKNKPRMHNTEQPRVATAETAGTIW